MKHLLTKLTSTYIFSGECSCSQRYLQYFHKNGSHSCYQEYLQGPCTEGHQLILPDEGTKNFEPICVPTNCGKNETRFLDICFPIPNCESNEFVKFLWQTNTTQCELKEPIEIPFRRGGSVVGGQETCPKGYSKVFGNCKKKVANNGPKRPKKNNTSYGHAGNLKLYLLSG